MLEPKLDYILSLNRLNVTFYQVNHLSGQATPLILRTNVAGDTAPVGDSYGIEVFWSFENQQPSSLHGYHDGSCRLGKTQTITIPDRKKFNKPKLYIAMYSFCAI
jgi:hypothetical protein